jgi:heme-degrading monooxygenase HmoA
MIVRVWRGRTSLAKAEAYKTFLRETAYPDYGEAKGNRGWMLLSRPDAQTVEFMFVSFWDSMQALAQYTGGEPERPKYYAEDRAALLELPDRVDHFEAIDIRTGW